MASDVGGGCLVAVFVKECALVGDHNLFKQARKDSKTVPRESHPVPPTYIIHPIRSRSPHAYTSFCFVLSPYKLTSILPLFFLRVSPY